MFFSVDKLIWLSENAQAKAWKSAGSICAFNKTSGQMTQKMFKNNLEIKSHNIISSQLSMDIDSSFE